MFTQVIQVFPQDDYMIFVYFADGKIKKYNAKPLVGKGVFQCLEDKRLFLERCTVLNNTLAWDISGNYDPARCIDIDPEVLYNESVEVPDPLNTVA